jgi:acetyl-CoA carboxylase carboxyl transferase subunit alpha
MLRSSPFVTLHLLPSLEPSPATPYPIPPLATTASIAGSVPKGKIKTLRLTTPAAKDMEPGKSLRHTLEFEKPLASLEQQIRDLEIVQAEKGVDYSAELQQLRLNYTAVLRKTYDNLTAWETVQVARHPQRPLFRDYLEAICPGAEFREIHGDRFFGDDQAIVCGLARIGRHKVMLIGHHKGRNTAERIKCNFGLAQPEGYRKALRCMKLAEKFHLPVVCLIDTPGAAPGIGAEERGQAESIARNLFEMSRLKTQIVAIVIGEGGSGGALGIGVADRVAMFQYAWYSVISPEACSAILFKGNEGAPQLAESLKLTSKHLKQLNVVDHVIPEPLGGAHRDPHTAAHSLEQYIAKTIGDLKRSKIDNLLDRRYARFRNLGVVG